MKTKRAFIAAFFLLAGTMAGNAENKQKQPNIILILADDLGFGDLSCYGSQRIKTPHIDKMASEGIRFTSFYSGSAVCTPTRVSVITGRYPLRFNVMQHFNDQEMYLQRDVPTLPKALKEAGYITKHVGKWHLGGLNEAHIKDRANSMPGPIEHGFDHYLAMVEDPLYRKPAMLERRLYKDGAKHLVRDEKIIEPIDRHWTDVKTDEAIRFIETSSKGNQPFFLNLWFDTPHAPYEPAPDVSLNPYKKRAKGDDLLYRSMVTHLDYSVDRVLSKLKELGIAENTLVVFTSDNGPAFQGSPGGFKGRKLDFHEGGIRVPGIVWWPGTVKPRVEEKQLFHTNDIFPTFAAVAKAPVKKKYKLDGVNLLPSIVEDKEVDHGIVFWQIKLYPRNYNYVKVTDKRPEPVVTEVARKGKWKLLAREGKPVELFNLDEDPFERWNLVKDYPEVTKELSSALNKWLKEPRMKRPY
ncbi:arylsulfatase [Prolixibacteraceae bacterium JC049]|nr:arylsulfatase [Prolixibacteraceae bacterium JC049]